MMNKACFLVPNKIYVVEDMPSEDPRTWIAARREKVLALNLDPALNKWECLRAIRESVGPSWPVWFVLDGNPGWVKASPAKNGDLLIVESVELNPENRRLSSPSWVVRGTWITGGNSFPAYCKVRSGDEKYLILSPCGRRQNQEPRNQY